MSRRQVANPRNPYDVYDVEWLGPPPESRLEVYEEHAKSIVSTNDSPDLSFRYSVNPYRGCQHACAYCYARPTHEYLGLGAGTDFDHKITVKVNAPELLARRFRSRSWEGDLLAFSGVTDCYQPLEAVYRLTEQCLRVCHDFCNPVGIVTKSYLVVRDAELLASLAARASLRVYISIPFAEDAPARLIESGAPPPSRRFEAIRRLREAGVPVAVLVAPIIPGLSDREIPEVLKRAADAGAEFAGCSPLRLAGSVEQVFFDRLRATMPGAVGKIEQALRSVRGGALNDARFGARMKGVGPYWDSIAQLFETTAARYGLQWKEELAGDAHRQRKVRPEPKGPVQLPLF